MAPRTMSAADANDNGDRTAGDTLLIDDFETAYRLGHAPMDDTHREFVALVNALAVAAGDDFASGFDALVAHTERHFDAEQRLMQRFAFPATTEHRGEHQRVLGQLHQVQARVRRGSLSMARAFVSDALPAWFRLHALTMDSALAAHLAGRSE
jgi:hemerythrin-like metal-binding protein